MFVKADKGTKSNANDKVMTPEHIAKMLIKLVEKDIGKYESVFDPFYGEGAFFDNFPKYKLCHLCYAEIDKGRDFFDFNHKVDWIISNPPYSILDAVLDHSFEISDNVAYLLPLSKVFSSMGRIRKQFEYGNIKAIWILPAGKCGFPFGFPACFIWWKRGYGGDTQIKELKV